MKRRLQRQNPKAYAQTGIIRVWGMRFWGKHGANPGERQRAQPIDVDVSVRVGIENAARSDALEQTIDYAQIFQTCEQIVTRQSFNLLETLAHAIADALWRKHSMLSIRVRVRKPRLLDGATPEIQINRRRMP